MPKMLTNPIAFPVEALAMQLHETLVARGLQRLAQWACCSIQAVLITCEMLDKAMLWPEFRIPRLIIPVTVLNGTILIVSGVDLNGASQGSLTRLRGSYQHACWPSC